eukprot:Gregarina_sp_Pseudo_9__5727@NODE_832_length_2151_cov_144_365057_g780_i0_p1_GENE_NODE_832_length_2151_cov_144_365057_g780_i0NODE_832_length_2151_cov_144_365057_g780_i0_p1_ORF_typecomplete_len525_score156_93Integrin_beta/PF00362_18/1_3e20Integrin_beta/PF00362_18/0_00098RseC_MucC/PF04246_12/0_22_NODE_832_length_2151_cov_144_365057_g780_i01341708
MKLANLSLLCALVAGEEKECNYALELLALQDSSDSFNSFIQDWKKTAAALNQALLDHFGTFKMGLSSFTDKPIPYRGYGNYGNYQIYNWDYCYHADVPLGTDTDAFVKGLGDLSMSAGGDIPEGQFEALLYAALDSKVGWSEPEVTHSEDGRPIVRVVMLITDAKSHEAGDAAKGIMPWNVARQYPEGFGANSTGGFGAHSFYATRGVNVFDPSNEARYAEMADLYRVKDAAAAGQGDALTAAQQTRLDELIAHFGPEVYPDLAWPTHPGDASPAADCTRTEYPTFDQVVTVLKARHIYPVFILTKQSVAAFYEWYGGTITDLEYAIATMTDESLQEIVIEAITNIVDKICVAPSFTEPPEETGEAAPSEGPTEAAPSEEPAPSEVPSEAATDGAVSGEATDGAVSVEATDGAVSGEATDGAGSGEATNGAGSGETGVGETTTTEEAAAAAVPPAAGSNIGTIAGAAAGAAAGLAAVAGVLWKTVGFGALRGSSNSQEGAEQVEVPENQVEREAMEEVTMDMFN